MSRSPSRTAGGLVLLALTALAAACGSGDPAASSRPPAAADASAIQVLDGEPARPALPVTVRSADGRQVTVKDSSRLLAVSLTGSLAEIVVTLGLGDLLVGRDIATTFAPADRLPLVTQAHDLSAEGVLALDPTLILVDTDIGPPEALDQLRQAGVAVVMVEDAVDLAGIAPRIRAVATALGVPAAGERLVERTAADVAAAGGLAPEGSVRPRIAMLYLRGSSGVYLMAGAGSGADAMIQAIGAVDAGTAIGLRKFRPITSEALINAAPDVLLLMSSGLESVGGIDGLFALPGVAQTPAAQHRRVVTVDDQSLLAFGPRTGQVLRDLAAQVYAPADAGDLADRAPAG